jgi:hypothetical protein
MSDASQIVFALGILAVFFLLSKKVYAYRINRACIAIIEDLKQQDALDSSTAVELPYAKSNLMKTVLQMKMKDFRPKAIEHLMTHNIVGMTGNGHYYLKKGRDFKWTPELSI